MLMRLMPESLAAGLFGLSNTQIAVFISGMALIFGINRWRRNAVNKRMHTPDTPKAVRETLDMRQFSQEIASLLGEVEETARRLTAQIDNRYTRLEQLVAEADEKIRRLEELQGKALGGTQTSGAKIEVNRGEVEMIHRSASEIAKLRPKPANGEPTNAQRALSRLRQERGAPPATEDPAYQPIYSLADGGKSPREIAQQLGRQPGEVELILALRGR